MKTWNVIYVVNIILGKWILNYVIWDIDFVNLYGNFKRLVVVMIIKYKDYIVIERLCGDGIEKMIMLAVMLFYI